MLCLLHILADICCLAAASSSLACCLSLGLCSHRVWQIELVGLGFRNQVVQLLPLALHCEVLQHNIW